MKKHVDILIYLAGGILAASAVPQILDYLHHPEHAGLQSIAISGLTVCGNMLSICCGVITRERSVVITCCIGALLNTILLFEVVNAQAA